MARLFLFVLLLPELAFPGQVVKEYAFPSPRFVNGSVSLAGCRPAFIAYAPDVPVKPVVLILPYGQKAVSYRVDYGAPTELAGSFSVGPFRPGGRLSAKPPADYLLHKSAAYFTDRYFPAAVQGNGFAMQYKNGQPLFVAKVNPVQYNPQTGKLRWFNRIRVTVTTAPGAAPAYKSNPMVRDRLSHLADNPEAAAKLADSPVSSDDYEYLVVTTDALKNCFGAFTAFNTRRCLRTRVATIESIRTLMPGIDDQEKIRNYIRQEYTERNIVYVLLAGDAEPGAPNRIPHRGMRAEVYDYGRDYYDEPDIPADLYYSCLDGTWRNAGSSYFGEYGSEDLTYEVYAARFPVDDTLELSNMVRKTIEYSERPVAGEVCNALLAGERLWGTWDGHPVDCYGDFEMEQLVGNSTANSYTTAGFPTTWNFIKLYDKTGPWSGGDFISALKTGKAAWIDHEGHANPWYVFRMPAFYVTKENFPQDGVAANYFFAYSGGCDPGAFDNRDDNKNYSSEDCFGEDLVTAATGAVAVVFNARFGFADDGSNGTSGTDGSNQRLRRYFHDAIFSKGIHYAEMMNASSKEANANIILDPDLNKVPYYGQLKWCAYETNLLGDPALSLWTKTPSALAPVLPSTLTIARFSMKTPPYSWVALAGADGAIFCTQLTDSSGVCSMQNDPLTRYARDNPHGVLKVSIKAHNYYPYSGEVRLDLPLRDAADERFNFRVRLVRAGDRYWLRYSVPAAGVVRMELHDVKGALVQAAVDQEQGRGEHWAALMALRSGMYAYRVVAGNLHESGRFVIVK
jgi:hypothetical protein